VKNKMSDKVQSRTSIFLIIFLLATGFALAASISVSAPQKLGSNSATVSAPPGVSVTSVTWTLASNPAYVDKIHVTFSFTQAYTGKVYVVVKDLTGSVLTTGNNPWSYDTLSVPAGTTLTSNIDFSPDLPAASVGYVGVTVLP
jgi:hypothetical protein